MKKSFWEQYKMPILLLGGIAIGSVIGIIASMMVTRLVEGKDWLEKKLAAGELK